MNVRQDKFKLVLYTFTALFTYMYKDIGEYSYMRRVNKALQTKIILKSKTHTDPF